MNKQTAHPPVSRRVAVRHDEQARYLDTPPFHPSEDYPELPFAERSPEPNRPYAMLRELFLDLGLDTARAGTAAWNPLGAWLQPGQTALIKPNFVASVNGSGGDLFSVITHPSLLRAMIDYCYIALQGRGRIVVADAPDMGCQWEVLMRAQRLDAVQAWYRERFGFDVEVADLRDFEMARPGGPAYAADRVRRPGDPAGFTRINLARESAFHGLPSDNYYGADYNREETIRNHHGETHAYSVSNTFLQADAVFSMPKLKVHKKVGVTLNLKGLVGVNTNKNCLIHYRIGPPSAQGDQIPDGLPGGEQRLLKIQRWLYDHALARQNRLGDAVYAACRFAYRTFVKPLRPVTRATRMLDGGNWHGNDSAWRMTTDLATILYFADREGRLHDTVQRRIFCVIDGITGGENDGPLAPTPVASGCLIGGGNPLAVDLAATRLIGIDPARIRQFSLLAHPRRDFGVRDINDLTITVNGKPVEAPRYFSPAWPSPVRPFTPHPGWRGAIELTTSNEGQPRTP